MVVLLRTVISHYRFEFVVDSVVVVVAVVVLAMAVVMVAVVIVAVVVAIASLPFGLPLTEPSVLPPRVIPFLGDLVVFCCLQLRLLYFGNSFGNFFIKQPF